jgi:drug/metabolite transporter (DMT)-like permease
MSANAAGRLSPWVSRRDIARATPKTLEDNAQSDEDKEQNVELNAHSSVYSDNFDFSEMRQDDGYRMTENDILPAMQRAAHRRKHKAGMTMGLACVLVWSTTAMLVSLGGKRMSAWQFVACASGLGGAAQWAYYIFAAPRGISCLRLPWRLWAVTALAFVPYGLILPTALILCGANDAELCGVNLINYLWPVLTVVCALLWVPGTALTWRMALAIPLALAGLALANQDVVAAWAHGRAGGPALPYVLAGAAAIIWATYSSLLARWRGWANRYATAPIGFVLTGAIAAAICQMNHQWSPLDGRAAVSILLCGLGPFGFGYLLWELALHRAPAGSLGLLATAIPVLSTVLLCAVSGHWPASIFLAAGMVSVAALFSAKRQSSNC